jgi:hypothetical protein
MKFDITKLVAVLALAYIWGLLDKIRYNYPNTIFARIKNQKLQQWFDPSRSQKNKWIFKSKIMDFLFSTVFVCFSDLWHFLKTILLLTIFYFLWRLLPEGEKWYWQVLIMFFIYGVTFELTYSLDWFWWLDNKDKKK